MNNDWSRRDVLAAGSASLALAATSPAFGMQNDNAAGSTIQVDLRRVEGPLEHIWSKCVGSDRAAITLREQWRRDIERFHKETGTERVRFHGIFADELGVYSPSIMNRTGEMIWHNVDQVYDGLLERGVQPLVELSFMPKKLASGNATFGFYNANITPPKSLEEYGNFIRAFATHLIGRYGAPEVRQWMFEVWNEPNLAFFFTGKQADYFAMYKAAAQALKSVDPALKVGGPATAHAAWVPEFLSYCAEQGAPVDFVATHIYAGDKQQEIFGRTGISQNDVIPMAMAQVRQQIDATRFKGAPLWLTEWSSDSPAMITHVIKNCLPNVQAMSQWVASGVYEELGVANFRLKEGDAGWPMMALGGIPRPAFNTYKLMHRLGQTRLAASDGPVLATRRVNGSAAVLLWNLAEVTQPAGIPGASSVRKVTGEAKRFRLKLSGARAGASARVSYVDQERGSPMPRWRAMGSPQYPTREQIAEIRASAELRAPEVRRVGRGGELVIALPPEGVALVEI